MTIQRVHPVPAFEPHRIQDQYLREYLSRLTDNIQQERSLRIKDFDILKLNNVPWIDVRTYGATGDGATDDTAAITAAIAATPTNGIISFEPGANYLITGDPALTFDGQYQIHFNGCIFSYDGHGIAIQRGKAAAATFEACDQGHVQILRTEAISHDRTQSAASQLLGIGIKFLNMFTYQFKGSAYVNGFCYGYYLEGNGTGCTIAQLHSPQAQDCLIDFYCKPTTTTGSYVTAIDIYSPYTTFAPSWYSVITGSRNLETVKNGKIVDGIAVWGGTLEAAKERKIKLDSNECQLIGTYFDISNGGTDIEFVSGATRNIIIGGPGLNLQTISDSGTDNVVILPTELKGASNLVTEWTNHVSYAYDTFTSSGADITQAVKSTAGTKKAYSNGFLLIDGVQYIITFKLTLNGGTLPLFYSGADTSGGSPNIVHSTTLSGSNTIIVNGDGNTTFFLFEAPADCDFGISNFNIKRIWH